MSEHAQRLYEQIHGKDVGYDADPVFASYEPGDAGECRLCQSFDHESEDCPEYVGD